MLVCHFHTEISLLLTESAKVWGGLDLLEIVKTGQSVSDDLTLDGLLSVPMDIGEFTSLTKIWCKWLYADGNDFNQTWLVGFN